MDYILFGILAISLVTDLRQRKILNIVTLPSIVIGLVYYSWTMGWTGFVYSGQGALVGLGLLLIPFLMGGMGAGDVKLMAAIGALQGTAFVFYAFLYTAIIGGLISLVILARAHRLAGFIRTTLILFATGNRGSIDFTHDDKAKLTFPYGIAIVLGTACAYIWGF